MRLTDYKVRVLDTTKATAAKVRVHIESTDGRRFWGTVGLSTNIIEASWDALVDSIEYFLYLNGNARMETSVMVIECSITHYPSDTR